MNKIYQLDFKNMSSNYFDKQLEKIIEGNLYRKLNVIEKNTPTAIFIDGKEYVNFGSNDYFGISKNHKVIQKGMEVLEQFGSNICSAQTLCGYSIHHKNLSSTVGNILGIENVLIFSSGYLANLSIFQIFLKGETDIFMDIYSHRSLIDSARLAGMNLFFYKHLDYGMLRRLISRSRAKYKIIATDSVFSMEGTIVDLKEIARIKEENGAYLIIDDAHGFMVLNNNIFNYFDIKMSNIDNIIYIATFSKSTGCLGGFLAGKKVLLELIKNKSSTFLFDTSLPPYICAMANKALEILTQDGSYYNKLRENIYFLNRNLGMNQSVPIFIKKYKSIDELDIIYTYLLENNIYVPAIKPPTVPEHQCKLRISVSALHTKEQLSNLSQCLLS